MRTGIVAAGVGVLITGIVLIVLGFLMKGYSTTENTSVEIIPGIETPATIETHPYAEIGGWLFLIGLYALIPIGIITAIIGGVLKSNQPMMPYQSPVQPQYYPQPLPQILPQPQPPTPSSPIQPALSAFCGKCGKPLTLNNQFCPSCGNPRS